MTAKAYKINLQLVLTLNDNDEEWNKLPETLPEEVSKSIAQVFSSQGEYYDGFTDMIIEACGCDVETYKVDVVSDPECRCDSDEPCPIHY